VVKRAAAIYEQGTVLAKGNFAGIGVGTADAGLGVGKTSSEAMSLAAQANAPPQLTCRLCTGHFRHRTFHRMYRLCLIKEPRVSIVGKCNYRGGLHCGRDFC
jgi:hypothetical protein